LSLNVLHIIHQVTTGGAARAMLAAAKYAARGGQTHRVVSLLPAANGAAALVADARLEVLNSPPAETLRREIEAADIVQLHFWNAPEVYEFVRRELPPARLLVWFHVGGAAPPQVITRELIEFADYAACCPYSFDLPVFQRLPADVRCRKTGTVYEGADFARLAGLARRPHDGFNVGYVGTVDFVKMHPRYAAMSAQIAVPGARFVVCGGGGAYPELRRQAAQAGAAERFDFRGPVEDIRPVLETMDVFGYPLCPDNYSASEQVLQEAMYAGVPPVVLPYGGAARVVSHGETGLIVDSEDEYPQAVEYLHRHPEERERLGRNAQARAAREFGAENTAARFGEIYERLMGGPKRGRRWPSARAGEDGADSSARLPAGGAGASLFVESLGDAAPQFRVSLTSEDAAELFAAERLIAGSSPVLSSAGGGGILHYRRRYPDDAHLRLWAGLVLRAAGRDAMAVAEFTRAVELGSDHWRVHWYLAESAARVGAFTLAADAARRVLAAAPDFAGARELLRRCPPPGRAV
jgi:glycosyltransferase involved in cell wall biosynthesis